MYTIPMMIRLTVGLQPAARLRTAVGGRLPGLRTVVRVRGRGCTETDFIGVAVLYRNG